VDQQGTHIIQKSHLKIKVRDQRTAYDIQSRVLSIFESKGMRALEQELDRLVPPGQVVVLDQLQLDLGHLKLDDLETTLPQLLATRLREAYDQARSQAGQAKTVDLKQIDAQTSDLQLLMRFLDQGTVGWESPATAFSAPALLDRILQDQPQALVAALLPALRLRHVRERLSLQFPQGQILRLLDLLADGIASMLVPLQQQLEALAEQLSVFPSSAVRRKSLVISFLLAIVGPRPVQDRSVAQLWPQMLAFFAAEEWVSRNMIAFRVASLDVPQLLQVISSLELTSDHSAIMAASRSSIWIDAEQRALLQVILPLLQNQVLANFEQSTALPLKIVLERSLATDPQWSQSMVNALAEAFNLDLPNVTKPKQPTSESDLLPQDQDRRETISAEEKAKAQQLLTQSALDIAKQNETEDKEIAKSKGPKDTSDSTNLETDKIDYQEVDRAENKDLRSQDPDSNSKDSKRDAADFTELEAAKSEHQEVKDAKNKDLRSENPDSKSKDSKRDAVDFTELEAAKSEHQEVKDAKNKDLRSQDPDSNSKDSKRDAADAGTEVAENAEESSVADPKSKTLKTLETDFNQVGPQDATLENEKGQIGRKELDTEKAEDEVLYDANRNPWRKRKKGVSDKTRKSLRVKKAAQNLRKSASEIENLSRTEKPQQRYSGHKGIPSQKSEQIFRSDLQKSMVPGKDESSATHRRRIQPKPNAYSKARRIKMAEERAQMRKILGIQDEENPTTNRRKLQKQAPESVAPTVKREPRREASYPFGNSWGSDKIHYVENAGLVLLNPFFQPCFEDLGWVVKGEFVDEEAQENAVLLVAYMGSGNLEIPESYLPLAKVLCGMDVGRPVRMEVDLEQRALDEANALLEAAAGYWEKAGKMSPDQLRGAFLMREGRLQDIMSGWNLKVDRQTIDILLEFLPWSFGTIKLPWMRQIFTVDW
jgi:hypothetical protein